MAKRTDVAGVLENVPLFSNCSKRDLQTIAKALEVMEVREGQAIVRQGEAGSAFYVLLDGSATVRRNGRKVGSLNAGEYFGELALLDPQPRNADVVADSHLQVARLIVGEFRKLLQSVPALNERLLAGLARRVHDADRRAVQ